MDLPIDRNEPLLKTAYEICRWHHERYDGSGYPDGLKEIPFRSLHRWSPWRMFMMRLPVNGVISQRIPMIQQ